MRRPVLTYATAAVVVALDQLSKWLVVRQLGGGRPLRLVGSFVQLRYTTNSGGAFSLLTGAPLFFALSAIVIAGGIVYAARRAQGRALLFALGLLLGGAVGNLLDRLLRGGVPLHGEVVDFVKVGPWPLFNLADSCITVGGLLLAYLLSRPERGADPQPGGLKSEAPTHVAGGHPQPSGSPPVNRGSGGLKSEAGATVAGGHPEPSGSPPVNRGSGGLKSEAGATVEGGHPQPSGSPPVNRAGGPPSTPPA
jgi:signal peptidase II